MAKLWKLNGTVDRLKKEDVTKRETEGVGENKIVRTVETEAYTAVIIGPDGQRVRLTQETPFDFMVEEVVTLEVRYGLQTSLDDDHDARKKKAK